MKPHMAHIQETIERKRQIEKAGNIDATYEQYMNLVRKAYLADYSKERIIDELENEMKRIEADKRENGDAIFQSGVRVSKTTCLNVIGRIIRELKGEE